METKDNASKIILDCNKQGEVKQLFLDTAGLFENSTFPVSLHTLVAPVSMKELASFWLSIHDNGMEENTVLTLRMNDKQITYLFSGYLLKETVLLCGNTELTSTEKVLEEIMIINNEQANQIRLTEKKVVNIINKAENREFNDAFLNDFTALNNELINNKRALTQKNKKIEILNQELNAVNQNLTLLTHSVSHDLKEPMRMVTSFLSILQKKYGQSLDQKGQSYLKIAMDGADRLSRMLGDLLEYHRTSNLSTTESVDLNEVLVEVRQILQTKISERKAIITNNKLPTVVGSLAGYVQVFQNLLSNAIKFVPEGKTPVITLNLEEGDSYYTFMVKDNGIGIAEDQRHAVFNLFKRLNSPQQYEGTGMGLAMVKKSIERMGGEIWLESHEGEGSTFYFTAKKATEY